MDNFDPNKTPKKQVLSAQIDLSKFEKATEDEKRQQDVMSQSTSFFKDGMRKLFKNPLAVASIIVLVAIILTIIIAPMIVPYGYEEILSINGKRDKGAKNLAPFTYSKAEQKFIDEGGTRFPHIMGTDEQCRDYFIRVIYGARISLVIGFFASIIVLIIGMTVVSIGTSLPEVIVSLAASLHEQRDLAVGTALGSNIINILLILGLAALVRPFTVHSDVLRRELPLMLLVSVVAGSVLYDGQLSRSDGIFLLFLAVLWLLFIVKLARQAERQGTDSLTREQLAELPRDGGLPVAFLWLGIALIIMPVATRMVVDNATVLANYFAISELTMGLTAIAIGTSLPELATAIAGVRKGENDIAVGNIIGANIFNIVIVLGLPALITPGEIDPLAYSRDYSVMLLVSIIFALLCWRRSPQPGRGVGVLLTGGFIVWLAMLYWLSPILVE